jgi:hypothetical protein
MIRQAARIQSPARDVATFGPNRGKIMRRNTADAE